MLVGLRHRPREFTGLDSAARPHEAAQSVYECINCCVSVSVLVERIVPHSVTSSGDALCMWIMFNGGGQIDLMG